ncbi:hypothetical protein BLNAU_12446 [Blattamonas nauphoetae]|uniref:Uncharacterized protein n=1 Tax=Blattamonas nauphoetae TaxID=2049346 RepID=A0ABQ9XJK0_9EUKA|nr:hypothetical protein BLNAU_12446 [Blattamonas nauphoetae]
MVRNGYNWNDDLLLKASSLIWVGRPMKTIVHGAHHTFRKASSNEDSPFLNWTRDGPHTSDSLSPVLLSLVSMVRNGYNWNDDLLLKASSLIWDLGSKLNVDDFLEAIGQGSTNPAAAFVDSMTVLLSMSHELIFNPTLVFMTRILQTCSSSNKLALVSSKLVPGILTSPNLQNLYVMANQTVLYIILNVLKNGIWLASPDSVRSLSADTNTDPQSIRDLMLHEVLAPIVPSLVQISHHYRLVFWGDEYGMIMRSVFSFFEVSAFHQPTLDFITSSPIPIVFQSLFTKAEDEYVHQILLLHISHNIAKWRTNGAETVGRDRILLRTLEQEGFESGRSTDCTTQASSVI